MGKITPQNYSTISKNQIGPDDLLVIEVRSGETGTRGTRTIKAQDLIETFDGYTREQVDEKFTSVNQAIETLGSLVASSVLTEQQVRDIANEEISDLDSRFESIESDVSGNTTDISDIQNEIDTITTDIDQKVDKTTSIGGRTIGDGITAEELLTGMRPSVVLVGSLEKEPFESNVPASIVRTYMAAIFYMQSGTGRCWRAMNYSQTGADSYQVAWKELSGNADLADELASFELTTQSYINSLQSGKLSASSTVAGLSFEQLNLAGDLGIKGADLVSRLLTWAIHFGTVDKVDNGHEVVSNPEEWPLNSVYINVRTGHMWRVKSISGSQIYWQEIVSGYDSVPLIRTIAGIALSNDITAKQLSQNLREFVISYGNEDKPNMNDEDPNHRLDPVSPEQAARMIEGQFYINEENGKCWRLHTIAPVYDENDSESIISYNLSWKPIPFLANSKVDRSTTIAGIPIGYGISLVEFVEHIDRSIIDYGTDDKIDGTETTATAPQIPLGMMYINVTNGKMWRVKSKTTNSIFWQPIRMTPDIDYTAASREIINRILVYGVTDKSDTQTITNIDFDTEGYVLGKLYINTTNGKMWKYDGYSNVTETTRTIYWVPLSHFLPEDALEEIEIAGLSIEDSITRNQLISAIGNGIVAYGSVNKPSYETLEPYLASAYVAGVTFYINVENGRMWKCTSIVANPIYGVAMYDVTWQEVTRPVSKLAEDISPYQVLVGSVDKPDLETTSDEITVNSYRPALFYLNNSNGRMWYKGAIFDNNGTYTISWHAINPEESGKAIFIPSSNSMPFPMKGYSKIAIGTKLFYAVTDNNSRNAFVYEYVLKSSEFQNSIWNYNWELLTTVRWYNSGGSPTSGPPATSNAYFPVGTIVYTGDLRPSSSPYIIMDAVVTVTPVYDDDALHPDYFSYTYDRILTSHSIVHGLNDTSDEVYSANAVDQQLDVIDGQLDHKAYFEYGAVNVTHPEYYDTDANHTMIGTYQVSGNLCTVTATAKSVNGWANVSYRLPYEPLSHSTVICRGIAGQIIYGYTSSANGENVITMQPSTGGTFSGDFDIYVTITYRMDDTSSQRSVYTQAELDLACAEAADNARIARDAEIVSLLEEI